MDANVPYYQLPSYNATHNIPFVSPTKYKFYQKSDIVSTLDKDKPNQKSYNKSNQQTDVDIVSTSDKDKPNPISYNASTSDKEYVKPYCDHNNPFFKDTIWDYWLMYWVIEKFRAVSYEKTREHTSKFVCCSCNRVCYWNIMATPNRPNCPLCEIARFLRSSPWQYVTTGPAPYLEYFLYEHKLFVNKKTISSSNQ